MIRHQKLCASTGAPLILHTAPNEVW